MKKLFLLIALLLAISFPQNTYAQVASSAPSAQLTPPKNQAPSGLDMRIIALNTVLRKHNSPLADYAHVFVTEADKNQIDWRLLPSISGLESSYGIHLIDGSYNAWGWGGGYIRFESWTDAITTISKALRERYYNRGADTVYTIAPIYAASPTWAPRVTIMMAEFDQEYNKLTGATTLPQHKFTL